MNNTSPIFTQAKLISSSLKSVFRLRTISLLVACSCAISSTSLYAQSITEQLEQGLGLSSKPAAEKPKPDEDQISNSELNLEQNLAGQIESLKQDMINLNRDLFVLEEDLLFPSSTQVAVYLSMDVGEYFNLDAVELVLNDQVMTNYLYTAKQVNALYKGGVQRLFVGNLSQGEHELTAYFIGAGPEDRNYKRAVSLKFTKDDDPVALELSVIDSTTKQQPLFEAKSL